MQTLIGRLTADAKINELKDGRKVVNFSLAMNRRYKAKGSDGVKEVTTFANCAFWQNTSIAQYLKKGTLIGTSGFIGVNTWNDAQGEARATITQHVSNIELYGKPQSKAAATPEPQPSTTGDDLPF